MFFACMGHSRRRCSESLEHDLPTGDKREHHNDETACFGLRSRGDSVHDVQQYVAGGGIPGGIRSVSQRFTASPTFSWRIPASPSTTTTTRCAELAGLALSGCYITLESARVSTDGIGGPYTDYVAEFPLVLFSSLLIVNHQFAGLTTLVPIRLEPVGGDLELAGIVHACDTSFFHDDCDATLAFKAPSASNPAGSVDVQGLRRQRQSAAIRSVATSSRLRRIPEPGTLALLFGAGIAGWWVRRRRVAA